MERSIDKERTPIPGTTLTSNASESSSWLDANINVHFTDMTYRLVLGYGMIGMMRIPKEYGGYMLEYTYSIWIC